MSRVAIHADARAIARLDQIDTLLQARATLLAMFDCNEHHAIAQQCRAFLADYRVAMRLHHDFALASPRTI